MERRIGLLAGAVAFFIFIFVKVAIGGPVDVDEGYRAKTAADAEIPVDRLEVRLRPLTQRELAVEADAWFELLRAKVEEISKNELGVKDENEQIQQGEVAADVAGEAEEAIEKAVEADVKEKSELLQELNHRRAERTALIDRIGVILDAWEAKGGEVEPYRLYVDAVAEVTIDVSDTSATWITLTGWLKSEEGGLRWARNLVGFAATVLVFWLFSMLVGKGIDRATRGSKRMSVLLQTFVGRTVRRAILFVGLIVAVSALEVNINPLLAVIGGVAFVVAFALQGTLSNFASGMLILAYQPFDVEDVVEAGGVNGKVAAMNLVSTHIRTFDNKLMIVPNNEVWGNVITNATGSEQRRVDLVFGIGYADDIARAQTIMERILAEHELVLDDPEPIVRVHELGDSSVNFVCRPWVKTEDYWEVYWGVTRAVKEEFDRQGVSIPFPQRDVHLYRAVSKAGRPAQE